MNGHAGQDCLDPGKVNAGRTACNSPYSCPAGNTCPTGDVCTEPVHCQQCPAGKVSLGVEPCVECVNQGQAATPDQSVCLQCGPGTKPEAAEAGAACGPGSDAVTGTLTGCSSCAACQGSTYSEFGVKCSECLPPRVVKVDSDTGIHNGCVSCSAGQEPIEDGTKYADGANRTTCMSCTDNTASIFGVSCAKCETGRAAKTDRTACDDIAEVAEITSPAIVADILDSSENLQPAVSLAASADECAMTEGSAAHKQFKDDLIAKLAAKLGCEPHQLKLGNIRPRNAVPKSAEEEAATTASCMAPAPDPAAAGRRRLGAVDLVFDVIIGAPDPAATVAALVAQLADPASELASALDASLPVRFSFGCGAGFYRGYGDPDCYVCEIGTTPVDAACTGTDSDGEACALAAGGEACAVESGCSFRAAACVPLPPRAQACHHPVDHQPFDFCALKMAAPAQDVLRGVPDGPCVGRDRRCLRALLGGHRAKRGP